MQNLRRDKVPISLLPSAFDQEKSCNRPPLFWHTGQGRDRGSVVVSAVGATPKGAAASGAGGPAECRCLGRRWTDASRGRGVASVFRAAPRLGAAFAGAEAVVCGMRSGRASRHARVRRASPRSRFRRPRAEAAPPHHGWCAGGRCRFVEVRAAPPR
ncbi:hypothetical protein VPH35_043934 [Triticum aestivum]